MRSLVVEIDALMIGTGTSVETVINSPDELALRARSGEEEAFRLIFEQYAGPIVRFTYAMVGSRELAEELMQETFVRAYDHRGRLRDDSRLGAWIFGIARNVALNAIRSRRSDTSLQVSDDLHEIDLPDARPSPDDQLLSKELDRVIGDALQTLTIDKRLVFTLKVLQQWTYEEIAEITGHSIPKLKTDLHRAKVEMRKLIRPYMENDNDLQ